MTDEAQATPEPTAPKIIYLQDGGNFGEPLPHYDDQVTWCGEPIEDDDTKYIRFDLHEAQVAALKQERDGLQAKYDRLHEAYAKGGKAEVERLGRALEELVACKDLKARNEADALLSSRQLRERDGPEWDALYRERHADYERRKPLAWEAARAAIGGAKNG